MGRVYDTDPDTRRDPKLPSLASASIYGRVLGWPLDCAATEAVGGIWSQTAKVEPPA